jgi:hypothetical protein
MTSSAEETLPGTPVFLTITPKIIVEWLTFLLCIYEVQGSDLSQEANYPDQGSSWYSSVLQAKAGIVP